MLIGMHTVQGVEFYYLNRIFEILKTRRRKDEQVFKKQNKLESC